MSGDPRTARGLNEASTGGFQGFTKINTGHPEFQSLTAFVYKAGFKEYCKQISKNKEPLIKIINRKFLSIVV